MATNRTTYQFTRNFHPDVVILDGYVSLASDASVVAPANDNTGRPTAGTTCVDGGTVAKGATGVYTLTLTGKYRRLRSLTVCMTYNGAPGVFDVRGRGDNIALTTAAGEQAIVFTTVGDNHLVSDVNAACGFYFQARLENR